MNTQGQKTLSQLYRGLLRSLIYGVIASIFFGGLLLEHQTASAAGVKQNKHNGQKKYKGKKSKLQVLNLQWGDVGKGPMVGKRYKRSYWAFRMPYSQGLAPVKKNGKFGYINTNGILVIALDYEYVGLFSNGLAKVKKNGKWYYINKKGYYVKDYK